MYMRLYETDPLVQLLAQLWAQNNRLLKPLLDLVSHQHYCMPCSTLYATYQTITGQSRRLKEAS